MTTIDHTQNLLARKECSSGLIRERDKRAVRAALDPSGTTVLSWIPVAESDIGAN